MGQLLVASVASTFGNGLLVLGGIILLIGGVAWLKSRSGAAIGVAVVGTVIAMGGSALLPSEPTSASSDGAEVTAPAPTLDPTSNALVEWKGRSDAYKRIGAFDDNFIQAKDDASTSDMLVALKKMREDRLYTNAWAIDGAPDEAVLVINEVFEKYETAIQLLIVGINADDIPTFNQGLQLIRDAQALMSDLIDKSNRAIDAYNALD